VRLHQYFRDFLPLGKHEGNEADGSIVLIGSDTELGRIEAIAGTLAMGWGSGINLFRFESGSGLS